MSHFKVLRTTVFIAVTSTVLFGAAYADDALKMDLSANKVIDNLMVTLPIPANMTFTGDAFPISAQASIDGKNYADMPLIRKVDGKLVKIPLSEYRTLRWNIKLLPNSKSAAVALNTTVS